MTIAEKIVESKDIHLAQEIAKGQLCARIYNDQKCEFIFSDGSIILLDRKKNEVETGVWYESEPILMN